MDPRFENTLAVESMLQRDNCLLLVIGIANATTVYYATTLRPTAHTIPPRPKTVRLGILGTHIDLLQSSLLHKVVDRCQLLPGFQQR